MVCRLIRIICLVAALRTPRVSSEDSEDDLPGLRVASEDSEDDLPEFSDEDFALLYAHKIEDTREADKAYADFPSAHGRQAALMQSVFKGSAKMVSWSLRNRADATLKYEDAGTPSEYYSTPAMVAAHEGHVHILVLLKEHGVAPQEVDAMQACYGSEDNHTKALAWMFDNGVSPTAIYEACMKVTSNESTEELLENLKIEHEEF